ncbi:MAG: CPBP family intramembrane metalloprotease [Bacteroidetes bacterium]|nr:CPBP family intramembrane metalloprotease [Bacteroidota bacterium]
MKPAALSHLSPFMKLLFVLMLLLTGLIISVFGSILITMVTYHADLNKIMLLLSDSGDPSSVPLLKALQILQSVFLFIVPAIFAGYLFEGHPGGYFGMNRKPGGLVLILVILILFVSLPLVNWMVSVNEMMKLPTFFHGIEEWMQTTEAQAEKLTNAFLDVHSAGGLALNLVMIAIIPAIGEELLFRGLFQRLFKEWFRNIHVAVFLSALIFGLVHMQFYGLLPRLMLGICFGYLYYWSGTIWVPVFAHFLNNGAAVVVSFLSNIGAVQADYEMIGSTNNAFVIAGSVVFTGMAMYGVFRLTKNAGIKNAEMKG